MQKRLANYTVIINREKRTGTSHICFVASVPTLGIATEADTLDKVQEEVRALIQFHLGCLVKESVAMNVLK